MVANGTTQFTQKDVFWSTKPFLLTNREGEIKLAGASQLISDDSFVHFELSVPPKVNTAENGWFKGATVCEISQFKVLV